MAMHRYSIAMCSEHQYVAIKHALPKCPATVEFVLEMARAPVTPHQRPRR